MSRDQTRSEPRPQRDEDRAPAKRPSRMRNFLGKALLVLISSLVSAAIPLVRDALQGAVSGGGPSDGLVSEIFRWTVVVVLEIIIFALVSAIVMALALVWRVFRLCWKIGKRLEQELEANGVRAAFALIQQIRRGTVAEEQPERLPIGKETLLAVVEPARVEPAKADAVISKKSDKEQEYAI